MKIPGEEKDRAKGRFKRDGTIVTVDIGRWGMQRQSGTVVIYDCIRHTDTDAGLAQLGERSTEVVMLRSCVQSTQAANFFFGVFSKFFCPIRATRVLPLLRWTYYKSNDTSPLLF